MKQPSSERLLGFDFGMKRIGVAVGQTITQTARGLTTLNAKEGIPDWETVNKLIKTWQPDALVVGVPLKMDGTEQNLTHAAKQFADSLHERYHLPVYGMDERLSTKAAREQLFNEGGYKAIQNGQIDSIAAQLILQNWLNMRSEHEK